MNKVVFLNGPARSGKDTAAKLLIEEFGCRHYKISQPLKTALGAFFSLSASDYARLFEGPDKDKAAPELYGDVPRQALISLSEEWAKRRYDNSVFGRLAVRHLRSPSDTPFTVISDSGFRTEAEVLVKWLGAKNCLLIQLSREGAIYDGDSRGYIDLSDIGVTTAEIRNNQTMELFKIQLTVAIDRWLEDAQSGRK